jgi:osmotically-inducible protein OsmY/sporulation protein YlmC with PRC-barrel domain
VTQETREATPSASERWEFRIGATVYTTDDTLGRLRQVVISPGEQRVVALVVRGGLPPRDYLVPLEAVRQAGEEEIQLSWTMEEARKRGRYEEKAFHTPERSLPGYARGEAVFGLRGGPPGRAAGGPPIRVGLRVVTLDGEMGPVNRILVDSATGRATHLVVRQSLLPPRDRLVPVDWVTGVTEAVVTLAATRADLSALPEYHQDEELADNILDAWWGDPILHALLIDSDLQPVVRAGIATLEGYARSSVQRRRLEELARKVPGVLDVRNEVVADDELELAVARALAKDPRTRGHDIQVQSYLGNIYLRGIVIDPETREAAAENAGRMPRVKTIINLVEVPGVPAAEPPRVLEPKVGQEVIARDSRFGRVSRVIMSPRTRLVTGIVVEGQLPDPKRADPNAFPEDWPRRERRVVIPVSMIDTVGTAVILRVGALEAAAAAELREAEFVAPDPSWGPPHPYHAEDLLLETHPMARPVAEMRTEHHASVAVPAPGAAPGAPMTWIAIVRGNRVRCVFGPIGVVDHLLIDPDTHEVAYLVVRGGQGLPKAGGPQRGPGPVPRMIPVDWIRTVDGDGILIDATPDQLAALPEYLPPRRDTVPGYPRSGRMERT